MKTPVSPSLQLGLGHLHDDGPLLGSYRRDR